MRGVGAVVSLCQVLSIVLAVGLEIWHLRRLRADLQFPARSRYFRRWLRHYLVWFAVISAISVAGLVQSSVTEILTRLALFNLGLAAFIATLLAMRDEWWDKEVQKRKSRELTKSQSGLPGDS